MIGRWIRGLWAALLAAALLLAACGPDDTVDDGVEEGVGSADDSDSAESAEDTTSDEDTTSEDDTSGGSADGLVEYESDAPFTFGVPAGWSVERSAGFDENDYNFYVAADTNQAVLDELIQRFGAEGVPGPVNFAEGLGPEFGDAFADDAATELGYVRITMGDAPLKDFTSGELYAWETTDDIAAYIADEWPDNTVTPVTIGPFEGFARSPADSPFGNQLIIYELLASPGQRVFAVDQIGNSIHGAQIGAIIASVRMK